MRYIWYTYKMPRISRTAQRTLLNNLTVAELAYIAGIIDGEGSITMGPRKSPVTGLRCRIPEITVTSVDKELTDWLKQRMGGSVARKSRSTKPNHKDQWCWLVRGAMATDVARAVLPYIVIERRRRRIEKLLTLKSSGWSKTQRESEYLESFAQELFVL